MPGCWYDPNRGPTQGGLLPYPPSQQRRLCPKPCTWRSAAAYACRSRSATADADRHTAVGHKSTDSVTTRSLAREPARSLRARGAGGAATMAFPHYSTRSTRGRPTPLRFRHLRSDARRLRAVLRCDTGIATNAHGTTAMRGRCRRRRPADSRATQSSHLPGTPRRRAPEVRRTWQRSRRALQRRCAPFGTRPGSTPVLQSTAGSTGRSGFRLDASMVGHAVCRSAAGGCQHCPRPTWPQPPRATSVEGPPLDRVLDLAEAEGPSRLPLRRSSSV